MEKWLEPVFTNLIENKKFCDCQILVENETFDCHKVILASASEFFERMFLSEFKESKSGRFHLSEVKPETFAKFLEYVYTYNKRNLMENTNSMIMELHNCGSTWLVGSIASDCLDILKARADYMVIGDLIELFQHSYNIGQRELIEISVRNFKHRFPSTMNCYDVLDLSLDVFEQYTIITKGLLPEVERFKMIESYVTVGNEAVEDVIECVDVAKDNEEETSETDGKPGTSKAISESTEAGAAVVRMGNLRLDKAKDSKIKMIHHKYIKTLLSYINFNNMTKNDFYDVVGKSVLLNNQEKYEGLYLTR
ncbi:kelch repeat and BTB domain-containing protein 3-like [Drosophila rhopaloa]|uniref:Kelch repeat and BTB domain-containing protein 3-like n=1 Tax=Drosophila rhopaloa TaxID=1041015 RepID=A0A6P4EZA6_DRORH|nr:kelch repeat and BTB domain-containing protein 3-like [Drosophila rhopaloa]XP_016983480.1 kelch repeat and BTB domain-containing protein 3-like [Drosophila rhopaloa]